MKWIGSSKVSWQPEMTGDTTTAAYWLNWRVGLCAFWISCFMVVASVLIWRYECCKKPENEQTQEEKRGILYEDEAWRPCLKDIHPAWLLAYRVAAFILLLAMLVVNVIIDSGGIFYYYTQWTFTLVTVYFGLGSLLSVYGCYQYRNRVSGERTDPEQGVYIASTSRETVNAFNLEKNPVAHNERLVRQKAGALAYILQVIFQVNAGAVMLTDFVFWFVIVPFLAIKDYNLNLLLIGMHSINAVFLFGDTALNSLLFPWFRIGYYILWTCVFVIFQWVVHACVSIWWPYPFLDLSSRYAPAWYLLVGLMHIPCYSFFALIIKMKHHWWSRWFPRTYQCRR